VSRGEHLFRTDDIHVGLRRHSVRSGATTIMARAAQLLLQLGSAMALARILSPLEFGLLAMVSPLSIVLNNVLNVAVQSAIIHREDLTAEECSAMFWESARTNFLLTGVMVLAAPLLARLYHEPRVIGIALAWAATLYVSSLASVPEALLKRQMRFGLVMKIQLGAMLVSLVVSVAAALLGAGYWALMVQASLMELTRAAAVWIVCPWRPEPFSRRHSGQPGLVALRGYWANLSAARVTSWFGDQLDRVVMGVVGGAPVLGLYDNAKRWATFPMLELWLAMTDVAVATLSRARRDAAMYRNYVKNTFLPILSAAFPAIAFIFVEAHTVLQVLLGNQWLGATTFLRLLCVATILGSVGRLMQWIYLSMGDTVRQFRWSMVTTPVMGVSILIGATRGPYGVVVGYLVAMVLLAIPNAMNALRITALSVPDCLRVFARPLAASLVAAAVLFAVDARLPAAGRPALGLALRLICYAALYGVTWVALPGGVAALRGIISGAQELRATSGEGTVPAAGDA
jgi:O-antigen/teichoic acid export membrane protein